MANKNDQLRGVEKHRAAQDVLNYIPSMIGYWDKELKNKFSNNAYLKFFNMKSEDIYGKHIREVIGESLYKLNKPYIDAVLQGKEQTFEREIPLPSGEVSHNQALYIPDFQDGEVLGFYVMVTDITPIKKIEKEKADIYRKLVESSKMVSLGEMAGGVAHEINNPLSIITLNAALAMELLSEGELDKRQLENYITNIQMTSNRIAKIVTGLQFFSQERSNDSFNNYSVAKVVDETVIFCMEKFKSHKISFLQSKIDPLLQIQCRPTQVSQVILNLLNNAADAVSDSETKWISLKVKDFEEKIQIYVSDSGPGIPENLVDKIMQPFVTSKKVGKGTGLGLSVSRGIVENHGGQLDLDLKASNTTFVVTLPKIQNQQLS